MRKDLDYYMGLNYPIEIRKIKEEEGGGYMATIPSLGKYAFVGDGETGEEALKSLDEIKEYLFEKYLQEGIPIPEPPEDEEEEKQFSGRFLLRIPSELHRELAHRAEANDTTLNQYCSYLLTRQSGIESAERDLSDIRV